MSREVSCVGRGAHVRLIVGAGVRSRSTRMMTVLLLVLTLIGANAQVAGAADPPPPPPGGSGSAGYLHPLNPARLLDTRTGLGAPTALSGGQYLDLQVTGRGGVPAGAGAVVLNVTVTQPTSSGYLTLYPAGSSRPTASNLNFSPGQTVPNLVVAKLGDGGKVSIFNSSGSAHVVADVMGWYDDLFASFPDIPEGGSRQHGMNPTRFLDTRTSADPVGAGQALELQVAGRSGVPSNATAVVLNVTAVQPTSNGYVTVYPSGTTRPTASNLNFTPGLVVPNLVIVKVGSNGSVKLFNSSGSTHLVVDAVAYFEPVTELLGGGEFSALLPARILDTRSGLGAPAAKVGPGQAISLQATGSGGVADLGVDSVLLNVTVTQPTSTGYITVYPSGTTRPTASNLNFTAGRTVPNLVVAKVGADGKVMIFNSAGTTHIVADVVGWFNSSGGGGAPPPFAAAGEMSASTAEAGPAAPHRRPSEVGVGSLSDTDPGFADRERRFWADHDPVEMAKRATPMPLGERPDEPESPAMSDPGESRFQIWSQGYTYPNTSTAIGRLIYYIPSEARWSNCTATMVARNLAVTAGHCVGNNVGFYSNFAFFGGLQGTTANGGTYKNVIDINFPAINGVHARFSSSYQWTADYAFVRFGPNSSGYYPGDYTGSFTMRANPSTLDWLNSYGYPSEGSWYSRYCSSPLNQNDAWCYLYTTWGKYGGWYNYGATGWYEIGWGSDMSGGASGGPVFRLYNGKYEIVSVNSNGQTEYCDVWVNGVCKWRRNVLNMWGPYFNQTMLNIYSTYAV